MTNAAGWFPNVAVIGNGGGSKHYQGEVSENFVIISSEDDEVGLSGTAELTRRRSAGQVNDVQRDKGRVQRSEQAGGAEKVELAQRGLEERQKRQKEARTASTEEED